jgi:hypothetical protein
MSSIAAPAPRLAVSAPDRWRTAAVPVTATVLAVIMAVYAWQYGNQPIRGDAQGYYDLAMQIVREGPLSFASPVRTYGYPAFLALLAPIAGTDPEQVRDAAFVVQLALFLGAAWIGSRRLSRALGMEARVPWIYAVTVLCPFILIHSTQMLTDTLSAILVYLAVTLSLPAEPSESSGHARRAVYLAMLALLLGGLAVIVRPANLVLLPVLVGAWIVRTVLTVRGRDLPWLAWPVLLIMLALPFVPQMAANSRAYGSNSPLITADLYAANTTIGMRTAKYATISITGVPARLYYVNPFAPADDVATLPQFLLHQPVNFVATVVIHAFALVDQDFPFTYITDLTPWYRWPLAVPNYLFVLGGLIGLLLGLRWPPPSDPASDPAARSRARFSFGLLTAAVGAMVAIYLPSAVECRFGLPLYPLLAAPFMLTTERLATWISGRPLRLGLILLGAAAWVGGMAAASLWMDQQAPALLAARAALAAPLPPSPSARYQVDLPDDWEPGQTVTLPITVTNTGADTWSANGFFPVAIRAQFVALKTEQYRQLPKGARVYVNPPKEIAPGETATVTATLETPTATGRYVMKVTVIRNGIDETTPDFERPVKVDKGR